MNWKSVDYEIECRPAFKLLYLAQKYKRNDNSEVKVKKVVILAVTMMLAVAASNSFAALYSYDFSAMGLAEGQNFLGATLDYATLGSESGTLAYTNNYGGGLHTGLDIGSTGDFYFNFSTAVDFVSFTGGDGAGDYDAFAVSLYEYGTGQLPRHFRNTGFRRTQ